LSSFPACRTRPVSAERVAPAPASSVSPGADERSHHQPSGTPTIRHRWPRCRTAMFAGAGLEVADDGVDDLGHRPAGAPAGDREPHRVTLGGRPAGAPQGHLQGCARRIWGSETTGRAGRGTMSEDGRAVGGRSWLPKGAGGARGWSWWWRAVMWAMSRVASVSGDRSGWAAASWSKTWPGRAQLARLQRRHLGTHTQLGQRHPEAHHGLDAHLGCSLRWSMSEPSCGPRHSGQAVSRQARQALAIMTGGRQGERSGARTREWRLQERVRGVWWGTRR
jgi:hypothetical protein